LLLGLQLAQKLLGIRTAIDIHVPLDNGE